MEDVAHCYFFVAIIAIVTSIALVITLGSVLSSNSKHLLLGWLNQLSSLSVSVGLSSI